MRYKKYLLSLLVGVSALQFSCTKDFEEMNKPWNQPLATEPDMFGVFNTVMSKAQTTGEEYHTYTAWMYMFSQQLAATTLASSYAPITVTRGVWNNHYSALLHARTLEDRIKSSQSPAYYSNLTGMLKTIMAYQTLRLTDFVGDMPYTEAGKGNEGVAGYYPKYDTQKDIYMACLNDLKWAVDNLKTDAAQFNIGNSDVLFKGDATKWAKFANALRLRHAIRIYEKDPATAGPIIAEALSKPLPPTTGERSDRNIGFWAYKMGGNWRLTFAVSRGWSFYGDCFVRMGSTMWKEMSANNNTDGSGIFDPRCRVYFEKNAAGEWKPYPQNQQVEDKANPYHQDREAIYPAYVGTVLPAYSPVNYFFGNDETGAPDLFISEAEIHFLKAEAYARGMGVAKNLATAKTEYEEGIKASVNFWYTDVIPNAAKINGATRTPWKVKPSDLTAAEMTSFLANPKVAFSADEATALKQIYTQYWIAMFNQPFEAWSLLRRTGATPKETDNDAYYQSYYAKYYRYPYPESEQSFNAENWRTSTDGGNDRMDKKVWWMK